MTLQHLVGASLLVMLVACSGAESPSDVLIEPIPSLVNPTPGIDPLSMPEQPTLSASDFHSVEDCASCHPTHVSEWRTSRHAYAMHDPVFRKLVEVRQTDFDGAEDRFCTQCHTAIGTRAGECSENFSFDDLSPIALEGVTCEACHKVSGIERTWNAGHRLDPAGPIRGPISDPVPNDYHTSAKSELHSSSDLCATCHDVVETQGLPMERPYEEWLSSPAASEGRGCASCHMPEYSGKAAVQGPEREGLHRHRFVGVDLPELEGFLPDDPELIALLEAESEALLASAASVALQLPATVTPGQQLDVVVQITNRIDAHNLPTGSTFLRQLWLELTATDAIGRVLYVTGDVDANGDLRDHWSELDPYGDADLVTLHSRLLNEAGEPELFPWKAVEHLSNALQPLHTRTHTLFVPTDAEVQGPIAISARLLFRPLPPHLLRKLQLEDLAAKLPVHAIASAQGTVALP